MLYYKILYYHILFYIILHYVILYYVILYYVILYYVILYYIIITYDYVSFVVEAGEKKNHRRVDKISSKKFKPGEKNPEEDGQDEEPQNWDHKSEITSLLRHESKNSSFINASAKLAYLIIRQEKDNPESLFRLCLWRKENQN